MLLIASTHAQGGDGFIMVAAADLAGVEEAGEQSVDGESAGGRRA
jgi:hypothetical protein